MAFDIMSLMAANPEMLDMLAGKAAMQMAPPQLGAPGGQAASPFGGVPAAMVPTAASPADTGAWDKMLNPPTTPPFSADPSQSAPAEAGRAPIGLSADQARLLMDQGKPVTRPTLGAPGIQRPGQVSLSPITLPGSPQQQQHVRPTLGQLLGR